MTIDSALRILLAVTDQRLGSALRASLQAAGLAAVSIVHIAEHLPAALRQTESHALIICGCPWDEHMRRRIVRVISEHPVPIIYLIHRETAGVVEEAVQSGVAACIVTGLGDEVRWQPVIAAAVAQFRLQQELRGHLDRARAELKDRKYIDRAKGLLMSRRQMSEAEAYRLLQKMAMDSKRRVGHVARDLLAGAGEGAGGT